MDQNIADRVRRIIHEQLRVPDDQILPEASFVDDLGGDSLSLTELTLALEAAFDIDIPDDEIVDIRTVEDAVEYVAKHMPKASSTRTDTPPEGLRRLRESRSEGPATTKMRAAPVAEPAPRDRAFFTVLRGANLGQMYRLDKETTILGRSVDATIRLHDDDVSRGHAEVTLSVSGVATIEDLESAGGTRVNGARIDAKTELRDGDRVQLGGRTILKLTYHDALDELVQLRLHEASVRDFLTNAFNRLYFLQRLVTEFAYARRHDAPLAVLMIDLDSFKAVNDTFGQAVGDEALTALARALGAVLRAEDVLARYDGARFAVLCRQTTVDEAAILAERLREAIAKPFVADGKPLRLTAAIGVSGVPDRAADTVEKFLAAATGAMFEAKRKGPGSVVVHRGAA